MDSPSDQNDHGEKGINSESAAASFRKIPFGSPSRKGDSFLGASCVEKDQGRGNRKVDEQMREKDSRMK